MIEELLDHSELMNLRVENFSLKSAQNHEDYQMVINIQHEMLHNALRLNYNVASMRKNDTSN